MELLMSPVGWIVIVVCGVVSGGTNIKTWCTPPLPQRQVVEPSGGTHHRVDAGSVELVFTLSQPRVTVVPAKAPVARWVSRVPPVGAALPHVPARSRRQQRAVRGGSNAYWPRSEDHVRQVFHIHGQPQASIAFLEIDDIGAFLERHGVSGANADGWKHPPAGLNMASP